jgi:hypothetical protein
MSESKQPFEQDAFLDKPAIVGARWWQRNLAEAPTVNRRNAIRSVLLVGGGLAGLGAIFAAVGAATSDDDYRTEPRSSLDMQREFGWSFGATSENLTFDGESRQPFDRAALDNLPKDLAPARGDLLAYFVPTLLQSPPALPRSQPAEDPAPFIPLRDALRPIFTPAMDLAYRRGRALASLFKGVPAGAALVVDLPGPEAVALAAGAAQVFDPVFTFDNWPHPRGVVPAHLTLAACAYYQPLFARTRASRAPGAPPLFVLDRQRLTPYTDDASQFDNRHIARLPGDHALGPLGVKRVLYVVPDASDTLELDDLNDDFVLYDASQIDVKMVAATMFAPDPTRAPAAVDESGKPDPEGSPPCFYGGSPDTHAWFWTDYPWAAAPARALLAPAVMSAGKDYRPKPRATAYSSGAAGGSISKPKPPGFGMVPVIIALGTGAILGAKLSRSGTWNRSSGGWGG